MTKIVKKVIAAFIKGLSWILIFVVMVIIATFIILQSSIVQNAISSKLTDFLSEKTGTKFDIGNIKISFFNNLELDNVYIEDYSLDTMIYVKKLDVGIRGVNFLESELNLGNILLDSGKVYIKKGFDNSINVAKVFSRLKGEHPIEFNIKINSHNITISNFSAMFKDSTGVQTSNSTLNFKDILANNINIDIDDISVSKSDIGCRIKDISLDEKSGLSLQGLNSNKINANKKQVSVEQLNFMLSKSYISFDPISIVFDSIPSIQNAQFNIGIKEGTLLSMSTLDYFLKKKLNKSLSVSLNGNIRGKLSEITSQLGLESNGSKLDAFVKVEGMPDIKSSTFSIDLKSLSTNSHSIRTISKDILKKPLNKNVIDIISRLGNIDVSCQFHGKLTDFSANTKIATGCGIVYLDAYIHPTDSTINSNGNINTSNFNLGRLLNSKKLGKISLRTKAENQYGEKKGIYSNGELVLDSLQYGDYNFHDIIVSGNFTDGLFNGEISSRRDSNLLFNAKGSCDLIHDSIPFYDFYMDLKNANLCALGLNKRDSISKICAQFSANIRGNDIDNLNGQSKIDSLFYMNQIDTIKTGAIKLIAQNNSRSKFFSFVSDFANIEFKGVNSYKHLIPYFKQFTKTYIPSYNDIDKIMLSYDSKDKKTAGKNVNITKDSLDVNSFYSVNITAKETSKFISIFVPGMEIAKGTYLNFYLNPKLNQFYLNAESDYISKGKTFIDGLKIRSHNNKDSLFLECNTESIDVGKFYLNGAGIKTSLYNNNLNLNAFFKDTSNFADIKLQAGFVKKPDGSNSIIMNLLPSKLKIDTSNWVIENQKVVFDSSHIFIDSVKIHSGIQNILIHGELGVNTEDTLRLSISNLDISPATFFISPAGYNISAITNGKVEMISLFKDKIIKGKLNLNDVVFTGEKFGNCFVESTYDQDSNRLLLDLTLDDGREPVSGYYGLSDRVLNLNTHFNNLRLCLLSPLLKGTLTDMSGTADANINFKLIKGIIPVLNGTAKIDSFATTVDFTKVRYTVPTGIINVKNNVITGENLTIYDADGNTANLNGVFESKDFIALSYNIDINSKRILALNTTKADNSDFFGKIYAQGNFRIGGNERKTLLKAEAWTSYNSDFNLPFSSVYTTDQDDFITFRDSINNPRPTIKQIKKKKFFNRLVRAKYSAEFEADLIIHATPDVQANLEYTNSVISNLISGRGSGRLELLVNTTKDIFTLNGGLDINSGTYRLIFSIADKTFSLKRGGIIKWNGDPSVPIVDLTGIYQVHTSLRPLTGSLYSGNNATIDCGIHLSGEFFSPTISFEITAPNATPETQSVLHNALNTEEALATQFFYLFLTNNFSSEGTNAEMSSMGTSFVSTTGFEFLSSNISSLLSTKNFIWKPTYKPRTEQNSQEFGVETQFNLLQNRMTLNFEGRYAIDPQYSNRRSPFTGGGNISYNLNKSGNLSLKAFTRVIDRFDETQGLQESGMGVYFTQEFTDWEDLKRRLQSIIDNKKNKKHK